MEGGDFPRARSIADFWTWHSSMRDYLRSLRTRKAIADSEYDPRAICECIEKIIFEHEDEPNLSELQNKIRKLAAGFDLCRELSFLHGRFSSLKMDEALSEFLHEEKFEAAARKIQKRNLLMKKEKEFFALKAQRSMRTSLADDSAPGAGKASRDVREETTNGNEGENESGAALRDETAAEGGDDRDIHVNTQTADEGIPSSRTDASVADVGRMHRTQMTDIPPIVHVDDAPVEPTHTYDLAAIANESTILEDGVRGASAVEDWSALANESRGLSGEAIPEVPEAEISGNEAGAIDGSAKDELDELPSLMEAPEERRKRKPRPMVDVPNYIPNYNRRAELSRNNCVQQPVRVYEGPPSLVRLFSTRHAFSAPAVNNGLKPAIAGSPLRNLYERNLKTERRPHSDASPGKWTRRCDDGNIDKAKVDEEIPIGFRSELQARTIRPLDASHATIPEGENLRGVARSADAIEDGLRGKPVWRLLRGEVTPPRVGASQPWLPPNCPRVQSLRGTSVEEVAAEPWFRSTHVEPPSEKWREFKFVKELLDKMWREAEEGGRPERVDLREVLDSEHDYSRVNWVTLYRVVDKLSLKREVVMARDNASVTVMPFRAPYVTELQYSLKDQPAKLS